MKRVVISQPMVFPWVGLFEQVRLANDFVHYDDTALPQGRSFTTRVQIKTAEGPRWLTIPVRRDRELIKDIAIDNDQNWQRRHLGTLRQAYARAPFVREMLELVEATYSKSFQGLAELNCFAVELVADYFGLKPRFLISSTLKAEGRATEKLVALCRKLQAAVYVTGHGARNYLDHEAFEQAGIAVEYMQYRKKPYPQLHGEFTPYVSILDLVANVGRNGADWLCSGACNWREFVHGS
jgi:hypothetical protein